MNSMKSSETKSTLTTSTLKPFSSFIVKTGKAARNYHRKEDHSKTPVTTTFPKVTDFINHKSDLQIIELKATKELSKQSHLVSSIVFFIVVFSMSLAPSKIRKVCVRLSNIKLKIFRFWRKWQIFRKQRSGTVSISTFPTVTLNFQKTLFGQVVFPSH